MQGSNGVNVSNMQSALQGKSVSSTVYWDTGFGCAIAATIAQFIAALLSYIAPFSAPASSGDADKPAEAIPAATVVASAEATPAAVVVASEPPTV